VKEIRMVSKQLLSARDLRTKTVYGSIDGRKVVVATVYSSVSLGIEERVETEQPRHQRRGAAPSQETKE